MKTDTFKHRVVYFLAAVLINASVFAGIPALSRFQNRNDHRQDYAPVLVTCWEPPPAPPVQKEAPPEPEKERTVREVPKMTFKTRHTPAPRPKMTLKIPATKFEINPMLATGMNIAPPPPEPAPVKADPEPAPVVADASPDTGPTPAAVSSLPSEFSAGEVDQAPRVIRKIEPVYPFRARRHNIRGNILVKFLVSRSGHVEKPVIVRADPEGVFEKSVLQAVRGWKFAPGIYRGEPVPTWVVLPIRFDMSG